MQMKRNKKLLSLILSMMLIVAMAFCTTACGGNDTENPKAGTEGDGQNTSDNTENDAQSATDNVENDAQSETTVLGEGSTVFTFTVVDADGKEKVYEIHTDKTTVGDALLELELIAGEEGPYGLYVKTVDGITIDYDTGGKYWAFYVNGEYGMTGVDVTPITEGESYSFKVE